MSRASVKTAFLIVFLSLFSVSVSAETPERLLLVSSAESAVPALSHKEVKRIFLAVPTVKNGLRLTPLRNATDDLITEVFLQKIIFMSQPHYEREIVARVFRDGGVRPQIFKDQEALVDQLLRAPESLTYMWESQLEKASGLKSIGVLWERAAY